MDTDIDPDVETHVASLAELLHETAKRHDSFEKIAPAHDWWDWYAPYMNARCCGSASDEASAAADQYMARVKQVAPRKDKRAGVAPHGPARARPLPSDDGDRFELLYRLGRF